MARRVCGGGGQGGSFGYAETVVWVTMPIRWARAPRTPCICVAHRLLALWRWRSGC